MPAGAPPPQGTVEQDNLRPKPLFSLENPLVVELIDRDHFDWLESSIPKRRHNGLGDDRVVVIGVLVALVIGIALGAIYAALARVGVVQLILGAVLSALTMWVALQYFLLPAFFPLVVDKGFAPLWYGLTFGVFGLALGMFRALLSGRRTHSK